MSQPKLSPSKQQRWNRRLSHHLLSKKSRVYYYKNTKKQHNTEFGWSTWGASKDKKCGDGAKASWAHRHIFSEETMSEKLRKSVICIIYNDRGISLLFTSFKVLPKIIERGLGPF